MVSNLNNMLSSFHPSTGVDEVVWVPSATGIFSVPEAMRILVIADNSNLLDWKKKIVWNNRVPSKISIFHWLACNRCFPVKETLIRRQILRDHFSSLCIWCNLIPESVELLLLHRTWSFSIWSALFNWWNVRWVIPKTILEFSSDWFHVMGIGDKKFWSLIGPATLWSIWLARNDFVFNDNYTCWKSIVRQIKLKVFPWATFHKLCCSHQFYVWEFNPALLCFSA
ncbi:uncharacterized protein [Rutidosis leptorrhynchoides]|uniref:uncharacterized protein n=1 Tax=Rutidosis leptorrhynchoides TaxID=125765 RepID=UPI003A997CEA